MGTTSRRSSMSCWCSCPIQPSSRSYCLRTQTSKAERDLLAPRPRRRRMRGKPAPGRRAWTVVCAPPASRCLHMVTSAATRLSTLPGTMTSPPCKLLPGPSRSSCQVGRSGHTHESPFSWSSQAARQPGKALVRPAAQAPQLASLPEITRTAHPAVSAQSGRSPSGFLLETEPRPLPQWWANLGLYLMPLEGSRGEKGRNIGTCLCCQSHWPDLGPTEPKHRGLKPEAMGPLVPEPDFECVV